ncbi:shikimate dehydrogenase [Deinococcus sonorensis]
MHNAAFRSVQMNGVYEARRVTPAELAGAVAGLRADDVLGANLSLPHKEAVLPLLDDLSPAARTIGAVNTIINRHGRLTGDNTDAPGLIEALREAGGGVPGASAVVLGAGGAARAAVYALRGQERRVYIVNRTFQKAQELAADWQTPSAEFQVIAARREAVPWADIGLIVNASSAGLDAPEQTPLPDLPRLAPGALVYDMVYKPARTRLMRDAEAAGFHAVNGLGMLAHQARLAFELWTGQAVPVQVFLDALEVPGA